MPRPKVEEKEETLHKHRWIKNSRDKYPHCDQAYKGHNCIALRVTSEEMDQIEKDWSMYYEQVQHTDAYRDFQAMREAWDAKNMALVKEIDGRVMSRNKVETNEYGEDVLEPISPQLPTPDSLGPNSNKSVYVLE